MTTLLNDNLNDIFQKQVSLEEIETQISRPQNNIINNLNELLANSYFLYLKLQNFHWNVTGPLFDTLHKLFQSQYSELSGSIDVIAEQIRILGEYTPGSFEQFKNYSNIKEELGVPDYKDMINQLINDNNIVMNSAKNLINSSKSLNDDATMDLAIERVRVHSKTIWFLKSLLE